MSNNQQQSGSGGAAASNAGQQPEQQPQSGTGSGKMMNQVEYAKYKQEDTDSSNFYAHSSEPTVGTKWTLQFVVINLIKSNYISTIGIACGMGWKVLL